MPRRRKLGWHLPCIYYLKDERTGLVKIGTSTRLFNRHRELSRDVGSVDGLTVLGVEVGDHRYEREIHRRFAEARVRGEWFEPTSAILDHIRRACRPTLGKLLADLPTSHLEELDVRLEAESRRINARRDEYRRRKAKRDQARKDQSTPARIRSGRAMHIGTLAYSVAWRNEWYDRVRVAFGPGNGDGKCFLVWYAEGVMESIQARAEREGAMWSSLGPYTFAQLEDRWLARHYLWCLYARISDVPTMDLLSLPVRAAFGLSLRFVDGAIPSAGLTHEKLFAAWAAMRMNGGIKAEIEAEIERVANMETDWQTNDS